MGPFRQNLEKVRNWATNQANVDILYVSHAAMMNNPVKRSAASTSFWVANWTQLQWQVLLIVRYTEKKQMKLKNDQQLTGRLAAYSALSSLLLWSADASAEVVYQNIDLISWSTPAIPPILIWMVMAPMT